MKPFHKFGIVKSSVHFVENSADMKKIMLVRNILAFNTDQRDFTDHTTKKNPGDR